jgi:hypothetical protein
MTLSCYSITCDGGRAFTAGIEVLDGVVVRAAPIIKYMIGWSVGDAMVYATRRGWGVEQAPAYINGKVPHNV